MARVAMHVPSTLPRSRTRPPPPGSSILAAMACSSLYMKARSIILRALSRESMSGARASKSYFPSLTMQSGTPFTRRPISGPVRGYVVAAKQPSWRGHRFPPGQGQVDLSGGGFAEYYPVSAIRTRAEHCKESPETRGSLPIYRRIISGGLTRIGRFRSALVCSSDSQYTSDFFSAQNAMKTGNYVPFHAEGGVFSSGAELTGKYDVNRELSTKFFLDYNQLVGRRGG